LSAGVSTLPVALSQTSASSLLFYDPSIYPTNNVRPLLVVDQRELVSHRKRRKTLRDHLEQLNANFEVRSLSVGDYLWLLKLPGGEELVLDYAVERKTWDDLKSSIRQTRYKEQKNRLRESGIQNIVLLVEGKNNVDHSLEQATVTTFVDDRFLVHFTQNMQNTAKFLVEITNRLEERCRRGHVYGPSFLSIQDESKKTKSQTISDCWYRQLTVCPGVSSEKAQLIATKFPTFRALTNCYRRNRTNDESESELLLNRIIPQVGRALSKQLFSFFKNGGSTNIPP